MTSVAAISSVKARVVLAAAFAAAGLGLGISAALDQQPDVEVVQQDPSTVPRPNPPPATSSAGGSAAPAQTPEQTAGSAPATTAPCTSPQPVADAVCQNGVWVNASAVATMTTGGYSNPNRCVTPQPGVGWTCQSGAWVPPGITIDPVTGQQFESASPFPVAPSPVTLLPPGASSAAVTGPPGAPSAAPGALPGAPTVFSGGLPGSANCMTQAPAPGWTCQHGVWIVSSGSGAVLPLSSPYPMMTAEYVPTGVAMIPVSPVNPASQLNNVTISSAPGPASPVIGLNAPCPVPQPAGNVVCQNGAWVTLGYGVVSQQPNAPSAVCTGAPPGVGFSCVNGVWTLADLGVENRQYPPAATPPAVPCSTASPGANYVCVNGSWVAR